MFRSTHSAGGPRLRKRAGIAAALAAVVALALSACGTGPAAETPAAGDQVKLGISVPDLGNPYFQVLIDTATEAVEAEGGTVVQTANANRDSGQQVTDFRNLISAGANVIMAGVVDKDAIAPALEYAESKGVPVVVVDDQPGAGPTTMVVKSDNYEMGKNAAAEMAARLPDGGTVLAINGELSTSNGKDRADGFAEEIAKHPEITLIEQSATQWNGPMSGDITTTVLSQHPDLAGIFIASDALFFDPVSAVLNGRGRLVPVGDEGHVVITGIDGSPVGMQAVRDGYMDATMSQPVVDYATLAVEYLGGALDGETFAAGETDHDSRIEDVDGRLVDLITAPTVTSENVDDPKLWGNAE